MLVISAGIKPNADLAIRSGLTVERGIVVDNQMRSVDDVNIYAVGECAQHQGMVYGLVAPIWEQVRVLADTLTRTNRDAAYHGSKLATKLKVMGVDVASMGRIEPEGVSNANGDAEQRQRVENAIALMAQDLGRPISIAQIAATLMVSERQMQRDSELSAG